MANLDDIDNDNLDEWFKKQGYSTRDLEYDLVYANGDNNLENLRRSDQTWKVRYDRRGVPAAHVRRAGRVEPLPFCQDSRQ